MSASGLNNFPLGIKKWSEEDRPREKLISKGGIVLSNAELIAILLGSGTKSHTALDLAKLILKEADNNLDTLGRFSLSKLKSIKGIGNAKAVSIAAAMELSRRKASSISSEKVRITSSRDIFEFITPLLSDLDHEHFYLVLLDRRNQIISYHQLSIGGVSGTIVDPKILFKKALEELASGIIICHNHPSGNLRPSNADITLTQKIKEGAGLFDILLLDHLIVAGKGYFSFADEGIL